MSPNKVIKVNIRRYKRIELDNILANVTFRPIQYLDELDSNIDKDNTPNNEYSTREHLLWIVNSNSSYVVIQDHMGTEGAKCNNNDQLKMISRKVTRNILNLQYSVMNRITNHSLYYIWMLSKQQRQYGKKLVLDNSNQQRNSK